MPSKQTSRLGMIHADTGELVEPPQEFNPYALLGIEQRAALDPESIRPAYLRACRDVHPDRFQDVGGEQLERAKTWTALVNKAHTTLKDQRLRLAWLLESEGFSNPLKEAKGSVVPHALLLEMFELQEMLDDAENGEDVETSDIELSRDDLSARCRGVEQDLVRIASEWDQAGSDHAVLADRIGECLAEERYFERLLERMNEILQNEA